MGLQIHGLKEVQASLKALMDKVGKASTVGGVELLGKAREGAGASVSNQKVMEHLDTGGRDFHSLGATETDTVAEAFAREVEARLGDIFKRANQAVKGAAKMGKTLTKAKSEQRAIDDLVAKAYKLAMMRYQEIVRQRFDTSTTADGQVHPVSQNDKGKYAKARAAKYHMPDDPNIVGRASGQLSGNVENPSAVRVTKRKK